MSADEVQMSTDTADLVLAQIETEMATRSFTELDEEDVLLVAQLLLRGNSPERCAALLGVSPTWIWVALEHPDVGAAYELMLKADARQRDHKNRKKGGYRDRAMSVLVELAEDDQVENNVRHKSAVDLAEFAGATRGSDDLKARVSLSKVKAGGPDADPRSLTVRSKLQSVTAHVQNGHVAVVVDDGGGSDGRSGGNGRRQVEGAVRTVNQTPRTVNQPPSRRRDRVASAVEDADAAEAAAVPTVDDPRTTSVKDKAYKGRVIDLG